MKCDSGVMIICDDAETPLSLQALARLDSWTRWQSRRPTASQGYALVTQIALMCPLDLVQQRSQRQLYSQAVREHLSPAARQRLLLSAQTLVVEVTAWAAQ